MANIKSEIVLNVELDENRVPEQLNWTARDGGIDNAEAKAMMLSVWDSKKTRIIENRPMDKRHASR